MFFQGDEQGLDSFDLENGCRKNRWDTLLDALLKSMMMDGEWPREAKGYIFAGPDLIAMDGNVQPLAMPESGLFKEDGRKRYSPTTVRSWEAMLHDNCPVYHPEAPLRREGLRWELGYREPGKRRHNRHIDDARWNLMMRLDGVIKSEASETSIVLCLDYKGNDIVSYDALKAEGAQALARGMASNVSNVFFLIGGAHGFDGKNDDDDGNFIKAVLEAFKRGGVPSHHILTVTLATDRELNPRLAPKFTAAKVAAYLAVDYARDELRKICLGVEARAKRSMGCMGAPAKLAPWAQTACRGRLTPPADMLPVTASASSQCREPADGQAADVVELEQKLLDKDVEIAELKQALAEMKSKLEAEATKFTAIEEKAHLMDSEAEVNEEQRRRLEAELSALKAAGATGSTCASNLVPAEHKPQANEGAKDWSRGMYASPPGNRWADSLEDDECEGANDDEGMAPSQLAEAFEAATPQPPGEPQQAAETEPQEAEKEEAAPPVSEEAQTQVVSHPAPEAPTAERGVNKDPAMSCQDTALANEAGKDMETPAQEKDFESAEVSKVLELNVEGKDASTTASEAHNSPKTPPPRRGWGSKVSADWAAAPEHEADPDEFPALGMGCVAGGKKKPPRQQRHK